MIDAAAALPAAAALACLLLAGAAQAQMIATDKPVYQPGETIIVTGEGWKPQEALSLTVDNASGSGAPFRVDLTAGMDGTFRDGSIQAQESFRDRKLTVLAHGASGAEAMVALGGGLAPGALNCPSLVPYDSSRYAMAPQQGTRCTIDGATDLSPEQQAGLAPVEVLIRTGTGIQRATDVSVSGTTIGFTWAAPLDACGTAVVSYGPVRACSGRSGRCATFPSQGNDANSSNISAKRRPAGFAFLGPDGWVAACPAPTQLRVEVVPQNGAFTAGSRIGYRIVVRNTALGSGTARNVKLTDLLPGNGNLVWEGSAATQGVCVNPIANNRLECALGDIEPQGSVTVTVLSAEHPPVEACQWQPHPAAEAVADGGAFATGWGSFTCTLPPPQLSVAKSPKDGTFTAGQQLQYTIVVSNPAAPGSAPATNVKLTDRLPTFGGLVWVHASTTAGTCSIAEGCLTCSLGAIPAGDSVTVVATSEENPPLTACQPQPNPAAIATADGGLTAQDSGSLTCSAASPALELTKSADSTTAELGQPIIYTYTVANGGNVPLTRVTVMDDNGTPGNASDDVTVGTVATLPPGASSTFTTSTVADAESILIHLGALAWERFAVLGLGGGQKHKKSGIEFKDGTVNGNVGLVSYGRFKHDKKAVVNGDFYRGENVTTKGHGRLNGSTVTDEELMNQLRTDAFSASEFFAALPVTPSVQAQFPVKNRHKKPNRLPSSHIHGDLTVTGRPGFNVVNLAELHVKGHLKLTGPPGTQFVLNISGKFKLDKGSISGEGAVGPNDILYNVIGKKGKVDLHHKTTGVGIVLAPRGEIKAENKEFDGELIGGYDRKIKLKRCTVTLPPAPQPPQVTGTSHAWALFGNLPVSATAATTVTIIPPHRRHGSK